MFYYSVCILHTHLPLAAAQELSRELEEKIQDLDPGREGGINNFEGDDSTQGTT